jgi:hypothetical protein
VRRTDFNPLLKPLPSILVAIVNRCFPVFLAGLRPGHYSRPIARKAALVGSL